VASSGLVVMFDQTEVPISVPSRCSRARSRSARDLTLNPPDAFHIYFYETTVPLAEVPLDATVGSDALTLAAPADPPVFGSAAIDLARVGDRERGHVHRSYPVLGPRGRGSTSCRHAAVTRHEI
jgi:hypothetical protein